MLRAFHAALGFGTLATVLAIAETAPAQVPGQVAYVPESEEAAVCDASTQVLREIMNIPARGIPMALMANAEGLAVVPGMIKGGFIVGVKHGRGVLLVRNEQRQWIAPTFITITGASFGWQIGLQGTDVILVFKSKNSIRSLLSGTLTLGAGASVAAGPVGREAAASTDVGLRAEIFSYSRSRGLFAGLALDGSVIGVDRYATARFYQPPGTLPAPGQAVPLPAAAGRLVSEVACYTGTPTVPLPQTVAPPGPLAPVPPAPPADATTVRTQLVDASQRLQAMLDPTWRAHLALPADLYTPSREPSRASLLAALGRYDAVSANPQYAALVQRAEFQTTHGLLQRYLGMAPSPTLALPPPPPR